MPERFNPAELADTEAAFEGRLQPDALPRLRAATLTIEAPVTLQVAFYRDMGGHCVAEGRAATTVSLTCQRCMEPVRLELDAAFRLGVVEDDAAAAALPEDLEPQVVGHHALTPATLIEDELLLALPVVARHADPADCGSRARHMSAGEAAQNERNNPFSVLKDLKSN